MDHKRTETADDQGNYVYVHNLQSELLQDDSAMSTANFAETSSAADRTDGTESYVQSADKNSDVNWSSSSSKGAYSSDSKFEDQNALPLKVSEPSNPAVSTRTLLLGEKANYLPSYAARKPGAVAIGPSKNPDNLEVQKKDEKSIYLAQPTTRPRTSSNSADPQNEDATTNKPIPSALPSSHPQSEASEPGMAITTTGKSSSSRNLNDENKRKFLAAPAGRPGAFAVTGSGNSSTAQEISKKEAVSAVHKVESGLLMKNQTPAVTKPGAVHVTPTTSSTVGNDSYEDANVIVGTVESDLLAKKRAIFHSAATKAGGVPSSGTDDVTAKHNDSGPLSEPKSKSSSSVTRDSSSSDAFSSVSSFQQLEAIEPERISPSVSKTAFVEAAESDLLAKKSAMASSTPATKPGAVRASFTDVTAKHNVSGPLSEPKSKSSSSVTRDGSSSNAFSSVSSFQQLEATEPERISPSVSKTAVVETAESDFLAKKSAMASCTPATKPGAVRASFTDVAANNIYGSLSEPKSKSSSRVTRDGSSSHAFSSVSSFQQLEATEPERISPSVSKTVVESVESDLLTKQRAMAPSGAATTPGVVHSFAGTDAKRKQFLSSQLSESRPQSSRRISRDGTPDAFSSVSSFQQLEATEPARIGQAESSIVADGAEYDILARHRSASSTFVVRSSGNLTLQPKKTFVAKSFVPQMEKSDSVVKQRVASGNLATESGVSTTSTREMEAVVDTVESDLLEKQRPAPSVRATFSGALSNYSPDSNAEGAGSESIVEQCLSTSETKPDNPNESSPPVDREVFSTKSRIDQNGLAEAYEMTPPKDAAMIISGNGAISSYIKANLESIDIERHILQLRHNNLEESNEYNVHDGRRSSEEEIIFSGHKTDDSIHDGQIEKKFSGNCDVLKDLAVAALVDEEAEKANLVGAEDFSPQNTTPAFRRSFLAALGVPVLVLIASIIVIVLVVPRRGDEEELSPKIVFSDESTYTPTMSPTSLDMLHLTGFMDSIIPQSIIDTAPITYEMAINWFANDDTWAGRQNNTLESPLMIERFLSAWLYFASSSNGEKPWVSCNPPDYALGQTNECIFFTLLPVDEAESSFIKYEGKPDTPRWLSNYSHCEWPGIRCYPNFPFFGECIGRIQEVELLGFGLSGSLPVVANQLGCLASLIISFNSDITGSIPSELANFSSPYFEVLEISNNTRLSGSIPEQLWGIESITEMKLGNNNLTGKIPNFEGRLPNLQTLFLHGNSFGGPLPVLRGDWFKQFKHLRLEQDRIGFTGTIPTEYGTLSDLEDFEINDNRIKGSIPQSFSNLTKIQNFRVNRNELTGEFPDIYWEDLENLFLGTNQMEGRLPTSLSAITTLRNLNVQENQFSDTIDEQIFTSNKQLVGVILRDNNFTGPIPAQLSVLDRLTSLWLDGNSFVGDVPFDICYLRGPEKLRFMTADCLGNPPQNYCFCCTSCCDSTLNACQRVDPTEV